MEMLIIIAPALCAGLLILSSHVTLGRQVLERRIIFIDLAIAQAAAIGSLLAVSLHIEIFWLIQLYAFSAALGCAGILWLIEKHHAQHQEPLIGCCFILLAASGFLISANDPHGAQAISELLSGDILWLRIENLYALAGASALALTVLFSLRQSTFRFYLAFAIAITVSVQCVGIYLVFASLILPALAVTSVKKYAVIIGIAIGFTAYAAGLLASVLFNLPASPCIVVALGASAAIFTLLRQGIHLYLSADRIG